MKQLTNLIIEFEEKINHLLEELQFIKMRAYLLEEENEKLRKEISDVYGHHLKDKVPKKPLGEGKAIENLSRLYNEGFHICHMHFGRSRVEGDCLFCMGLLKK